MNGQRESDDGMGGQRTVITDRDGQDFQNPPIKATDDENDGDCSVEADTQATEEDGKQEDADDDAGTASAAGPAAIAEENALLKEIEEQCVSHGRHPGEWDNIQLRWVHPMEPAAPYFCVSKRLMKPLRPREVICELLAAGLPVVPTAHVALGTSFERADRFVRASKRLVATARSTALELSAHVAVAAQQGILQESCSAFVADAVQALQSVSLSQAPEALAAVVRHILLT